MFEKYMFKQTLLPTVSRNHRMSGTALLVALPALSHDVFALFMYSVYIAPPSPKPYPRDFAI